MLTGVYGLNIPDSTVPSFYSSLTWDQALFSFRFENYIPAANFSGSRERECMRTAQVNSSQAFSYGHVEIWFLYNFQLDMYHFPFASILFLQKDRDV